MVSLLHQQSELRQQDATPPGPSLEEQLLTTRMEVSELSTWVSHQQRIEGRQERLLTELEALRPLQQDISRLEEVAREAVARNTELADALQDLRDNHSEHAALPSADIHRLQRLDVLELELRGLLPLESQLPRAAEELEEARAYESSAQAKLELSERLAQDAATHGIHVCEELARAGQHPEHGDVERLRGEVSHYRCEIQRRDAELERESAQLHASRSELLASLEQARLRDATLEKERTRSAALDMEVERLQKVEEELTLTVAREEARADSLETELRCLPESLEQRVPAGAPQDAQLTASFASPLEMQAHYAYESKYADLASELARSQRFELKRSEEVRLLEQTLHEERARSQSLQGHVGRLAALESEAAQYPKLEAKMAEVMEKLREVETQAAGRTGNTDRGGENGSAAPSPTSNGSASSPSAEEALPRRMDDSPVKSSSACTSPAREVAVQRQDADPAPPAQQPQPKEPTESVRVELASFLPWGDDSSEEEDSAQGATLPLPTAKPNGAEAPRKSPSITQASANYGADLANGLSAPYVGSQAGALNSQSAPWVGAASHDQASPWADRHDASAQRVAFGAAASSSQHANGVGESSDRWNSDSWHTRTSPQLQRSPKPPNLSPAGFRSCPSGPFARPSPPGSVSPLNPFAMSMTPT